MDSNVLDLLQRRYFLKDENGNLIENSWEELCARVTENIASAETSLENKEQYKDLFYKAMVNMDILPSSPVLFNSGTSLQQLSSCLTEDQFILTSDGFKPIKDVKVGDLVVTHRGRLRSVLKTSKRYTHEDLYIIKTKDLKLKVTGEHPILALKVEDTKQGVLPYWLKASEINKGDYIARFNLSYFDLDHIYVWSSLAETEYLWPYSLTHIEEIMIQDFEGYVYNLEVEEDNTYIANGIVVHNCFIIDIDDNMESIAEAWKEASLIFKSGGGVGFNISSLRPKGALVKSSNGEASGPISFMKVFNTIVEQVKQGGRRKGAIKVDLNVEHPDIIDFIHCKDNTSELNNMNISVSISDAFMEAVKNNKDWPLVFNDKVYRVVKARDLWDEIIKSAWATGEPGLSFRDTMDRANPNPHLGHVWSTNPCLHKDALMVTENGLEKISELKSKIWNGKEFVESKAWKTGIKDVVKITTKSGFEYITTPDHKFMLADDTWCEAKDLVGKKIKFDVGEKQWRGYNPYPDCDYRVLGFEFGDGTYHKASKRMKYIYVTLEKDNEVKSLIEKVFGYKFGCYGKDYIIEVPYGSIYAYAFSGSIPERLIPDWIFRLPPKEMSDFLRGLFSANGTHLPKYRRVQLVSCNKEMLKQVQQMLLLFGIKAKLWYHNKETQVQFKNGKYTCKKSYHLVISRCSYDKFMKKIGFIQQYKNDGWRLTKIIKDELPYEEVISVEPYGQAEVWDFTEPNLHQGITAGAYVHNCSEFVNIPYSSCNLASINLENMVENGELNWKKIEYYTRLTVRFLDDMIDVNKLPLKKIEEVTRLIRPIGLGTMGYANMLYKLGIRYGSQEAENLTKLLYEFIYKTALDESQKLAEERGFYPAWKGSVWEQKGIKVRNANLMSIAPNGSISFIAQTTGGIEPEFALVYQRTTNEGVKYFVCNKVFKKVLQENGLYSEELLKEIFEAGGSIQELALPEWLKEVFVVAHDLDPYEHLNTLAIVQKYVDMACSKTINLPSSATVDTVGAIYMKAWELGIKGVTVYRDGCRPNQVLATGTTAKVEQEKGQNNNSRGYIIPAKQKAKGIRTKLSTGCGSLWLSAFADEDGNIIEVFTDIGRGNCISNTQALSRMISLSLRGGISLEDIVDQLQSACTCPSYAVAKATGKEISPGKSCPSAIAVALKELQKEFKPNIEKETKVVVKTLCPQCGNELVSQSGCWQCNNCGYSKCG